MDGERYTMLKLVKDRLSVLVAQLCPTLCDLHSVVPNSLGL